MCAGSRSPRVNATGNVRDRQRGRPGRRCCCEGVEGEGADGGAVEGRLWRKENRPFYRSALAWVFTV